MESSTAFMNRKTQYCYVSPFQLIHCNSNKSLNRNVNVCMHLSVCRWVCVCFACTQLEKLILKFI